MILITATLTLHSTAFVFAQSNSTNSTSSSQSDNQTSGVENNPDSFYKYNLPTEPPTFSCLDESACANFHEKLGK